MKYFTLFLLFLPGIFFGQEGPANAFSKLGPNPLMIIDSLIVQPGDLMKYDANNIATVSVFSDTSAIKIYGDVAKDGAVVIETKIFARKKFIDFFRHASVQYDSLYKIHGNDSTFQYILNDKLLMDNFEGNLSIINKNILISIEILNSVQLRDKFGTTDKNYGILIKSDEPEGLYKADEKF